ncbi:hypothetical protein Droror1_Dr00013117 [Drosera rotundifolia]
MFVHVQVHFSPPYQRCDEDTTLIMSTISFDFPLPSFSIVLLTIIIIHLCILFHLILCTFLFFLPLTNFPRNFPHTLHFYLNHTPQKTPNLFHSMSFSSGVFGLLIWVQNFSPFRFEVMGVPDGYV